MEIWIATFNPNKVKEFRSLISDSPQITSVHTANEINGYFPPPENGSSFLENARIKAKSLFAIKNNQWVIAEDSGLVVPSLNGLPGIHSARYAGEKASDSENVSKILKMLQIRKVSDRSAFFNCTLVSYSPLGEEFVFEGQLMGKIGDKPLGNLGFGYDPIFIPTNQTQTLAELGPAYKNQHSHRAQAFKKWIERIQRNEQP